MEKFTPKYFYSPAFVHKHNAVVALSCSNTGIYLPHPLASNKLIINQLYQNILLFEEGLKIIKEIKNKVYLEIAKL
jgi:hypothetical protein